MFCFGICCRSMLILQVELRRQLRRCFRNSLHTKLRYRELPSSLQIFLQTLMGSHPRRRHQLAQQQLQELLRRLECVGKKTASIFFMDRGTQHILKVRTQTRKQQRHKKNNKQLNLPPPETALNNRKQPA